MHTIVSVPGPSLPQRLFYHVGIPFQNTFYIAGGHTGANAVNTVYRYEPKTGHWTLTPYRLSHPQRAIAAFTVDRRAFKN